MQPFPAVSSGNRALEEASAFKAIKDSQPSKLYFAECQKFRIIILKAEKNPIICHLETSLSFPYWNLLPTSALLPGMSSDPVESRRLAVHCPQDGGLPGAPAAPQRS